MTNRAVFAVAPLLLAGLTLLLSELRVFRITRLDDRLRATTGRMAHRSRRSRSLSVGSLHDVLGPLATWFGARVTHLLGAGDDVGRRLERIGSTDDVTTFRVRQLGWCVGAEALGVAFCVALTTSLPISIAVVIGAPLLSFLIVEQLLANRSAQWQRRLTMELPLVAEHLAMLLSTGYSLGTALARIAQRGTGICADGLTGVTRRIRQGIGEIQALREWSALADVAALERLVGVLALNHEASDLGALISSESRAVRRQVQRELLEIIEKRSQQVWIPVTVATLVPGVIFMAVPFIEAMHQLTGK
jgi:tight adherence protein C